MNLPDGYLLQGKKYRLTRSIGQGGFAITYLGIWNTEVKGGLGTMKTTVPVCIKEYFFKDYCYRDNHSFAVKVHSITGEKLFGRFKEKLIEEANILSAVHHPNIVNVLEVFEENNTAYIAMEFINGYSLKNILDKQGILPEQKVIKYTHQIGNALSFVHEKNIVHLDIKPGNILIDRDDNARLIDFGVSKRYDIEEQETSTTTLTLSKGFAAIEQYDNDEMQVFSPAPDIYSLGATMYNLLTGVIPVESILRATKQMLPPTAYNPAITHKTEKAILKAMEIKQKDRFRKVNELLAAIDAPVYEFTVNSVVEPTRQTDDEDQTEVLNRQGINSTDDEEDNTIINASITSGAKKKSKSRHVVRRRIILIATILLCAYIGYGVFSYFIDITSAGGTNEGISMPGDIISVRPNIALVNQGDSAESNDPVLPDSATVTSGLNNPVQTPATTPVKPVNNPQTQPTPATNTDPGNNQQAANQQNVGTEIKMPTYTTAQIAAMENDYQKLIFSAKTKASTGGFKGAKDDLLEASELGKKLGKNPTEVNKLIEEADNETLGKNPTEVIQPIEKTDKGTTVQEKEDISAKYDFGFPRLGELRIVRSKENDKIGAIDANGNVKIPCIYKTISIRGNNRAFIREDNTEDIYDKNGERLLQSITGPSKP